MTTPGRAALVTGASSGIGRSLSGALATRGYDLVLVARDAERLGELSAELSRRHAVHCEVLAADLAADEGLAAVERRIRDGDPLDVVVNNAGFGTAEPFASDRVGAAVGQIRLNVVALTVLSHAALSTMVPRRRGGLLNVSSTASFQPTPGQAVYGATKAFVTSLTESLHEEVAGSGVHVTALCPGFTRTEFHTRASIDPAGIPEFMWASPAAVAEAGLAALEANRAICITGGVNKVLAAATHLAPRSLIRRSAGRVVRRLT